MIVVYILVAFAWLTYSLLNYSNSDYTLKNDVLKAGLNACILQVVQESKNAKLGVDSSTAYYLKQLKLEVDPNTLDRFVQQRFQNNYIVEYIAFSDKTVIQIQINPDQVAALDREYNRQQKIWWFQSILLLILVATGVFGVFYSINSLFKLNRRQNNFLLSVTHEFKTPIAAIRLMLQTILNPKIKEEKKAELIHKSIDNTHRLEDLTENMLTATQIEYGQYQYFKQPFDLSQLMRDIHDSHSIKGDLALEVEDGIEYVGDKVILRIAVSNLLNNAFKYSEGSSVYLKLYKDGSRIFIEVADEGSGVPKSEKKRIFSKFYRVQDEETRTTKGTGLGLFIVKRAIINHNGQIEALDNQPRGTVFRISLPL